MAALCYYYMENKISLTGTAPVYTIIWPAFKERDASTKLLIDKLFHSKLRFAYKSVNLILVRNTYLTIENSFIYYHNKIYF